MITTPVDTMITKKKGLIVSDSSAIYLLLKTVLTIFLVTFLSFLLVRISPVDPAEAYVRRNMQQADSGTIDRIRSEMGLDLPLAAQYSSWLGGVLRLDFGTSLVSGKSVWSEFAGAIPYTLKMVLLSAGIQAAAAIMLGCLLYLSKHSPGHLILKFLTIGALSLPGFYIAAVYLDFFAMKLGWISVLNIAGFSRYLHPALCLAIPSSALYARMISASLSKEMNEDYVFYARCRGLSEVRILFRHALPQALLGLLPSFMQNLGFLMLGGSMIEIVFSFPGIGCLIIDAVLDRDAPIIHAAVLFLAVVFIIAELGATILSKLLKLESRKEDRPI